MIAADLKLQSNNPGEGLALAKEARHLLREVKKSEGRLPKGYSLATFAEVKALLEKARARSGFLAKTTGGEQSEQGSDNDKSDDDVADVPSELQEPAGSPASTPEKDDADQDMVKMLSEVPKAAETAKEAVA